MSLMIEKGVIETTFQGVAKVKTKRTDACAGCSAKSACHTLGGGKEMLVEVDNRLGAREGDLVEIAFETKSFLTVSFLVYFVPVLGLVTGAILGQQIGPKIGLDGGTGSVLVGLGLGLLSGTWTWQKAKTLETKAQYRPKVHRIIGPAGTSLALDTGVANVLEKDPDRL